MTAWMTGMGLPFWMLMVILIVDLLFLGCLMDSVSMLVLTLPFVVPMMQPHGANIIWFGVVFVMLAVHRGDYASLRTYDLCHEGDAGR